MTGTVDLVGIGTFLIGIGTIITAGWTIWQQRQINRHDERLTDLEKQ